MTSPTGWETEAQEANDGTIFQKPVVGEEWMSWNQVWAKDRWWESDVKTHKCPPLVVSENKLEIKRPPLVCEAAQLFLFLIF